MSIDTLVLRPPRPSDEAQARAAHAELSGEGFAYLFEPELTWTAQLRAMGREARGTKLPPDRVRSQFLVAEVADSGTGGAEIVGRVSIRHTLTPVLLAVGGHVGYAVRPAFRGRGYATAMLGHSVQILAAAGVNHVLVTCDQNNAASRLVIERCGGVLEDIVQIADGVPPKRRYWIDVAR